MGILKVVGRVLLIPLWFIISIIGGGVKLLVHMVAIAKKILGLGIMALFIGTVLCYQDWLQAAFLACMGGVLIFLVFDKIKGAAQQNLYSFCYTLAD